MIIVSLLRDLLRPETNYYGVFFAIIVAVGVVILGNGIIAGLYFLLKWLLR